MFEVMYALGPGRLESQLKMSRSDTSFQGLVQCSNVAEAYHNLNSSKTLVKVAELEQEVAVSAPVFHSQHSSGEAGLC